MVCSSKPRPMQAKSAANRNAIRRSKWPTLCVGPVIRGPPVAARDPFLWLAAPVRRWEECHCRCSPVLRIENSTRQRNLDAHAAVRRLPRNRPDTKSFCSRRPKPIRHPDTVGISEPVASRQSAAELHCALDLASCRPTSQANSDQARHVRSRRCPRRFRQDTLPRSTGVSARSPMRSF